MHRSVIKYKSTISIKRGIVLGSFALLGSATQAQAITLGGIDYGDTRDYFMIFTDGSNGAGWEAASKGYVGDVAVDGGADFRTSGKFGYGGTISTNGSSIGDWQDIIDNNDGTNNEFNNGASVSLNNATVDTLITQVNNVFTQVNAKTVDVTVTDPEDPFGGGGLDGWNTQNGVSETFVVDITGGFSISSAINITGDKDDFFIFRWDDSGTLSDGYDGQVKFQSGGAFVPNGDLLPGNFTHVAGDLSSSGGGSVPVGNIPTGPRDDNGFGDLCDGCVNYDQGGFFTGLWYTTGKPDNSVDATHLQPFGKTSDLSNFIINGAWYTISDQFKIVSGSSGAFSTEVEIATVPEPLTMLGVSTAIGFGTFFKRQTAKKKK